MELAEIKKIARLYNIVMPYYFDSKPEIIRKIQLELGFEDCFNRYEPHECDCGKCVWRGDCSAGGRALIFYRGDLR